MGVDYDDSGIAGATSNSESELVQDSQYDQIFYPDVKASELPTVVSLSQPIGIASNHPLLDQPKLDFVEESSNDPDESEETRVPLVENKLVGAATTTVIPFLNQLSGTVYSSNSAHDNEAIHTFTKEHCPTPETQPPAPKTTQDNSTKIFRVGSSSTALHQEHPPLQASVTKKLDEAKADFLDQMKQKDEKIARLQAQLHQTTQEKDQIEQELKNTKVEREKTISEKDEMIASLQKQIKEKEQTIDSLESRLSKKEQENEKLKQQHRQEIADLKKQLAELGDRYIQREKELEKKQHELERKIWELELNEQKLIVSLEKAKSQASYFETQIVKHQLKVEKMKRVSETMKRESCEKEIVRLTSQLSIASTSSSSTPALFESQVSTADSDEF